MAQMSLLYSVIKIVPLMMTLCRIAHFSTILFGCMWAALVIQKAYICAHDTAWEMTQKPQCHLGVSVGIMELVSEYSIPHQVQCNMLKYHWKKLTLYPMVSWWSSRFD
jgi:hypothetical protein